MRAGPGRQAVGAIGPLDRACASDPSPGTSVTEAHRDHEAEKDEESGELNRTLVRDSFVEGPDFFRSAGGDQPSNARTQSSALKCRDGYRQADRSYPCESLAGCKHPAH